MTRKEKVEFVRALTKSVCESAEGLIDRGDIPDDWDGIELRWWLADRFKQQQAATRSVGVSRRRRYINECRVKNL